MPEITIILNGQKKTSPNNCTVSELLKELELDRIPVAVEINREIIKREDFQRRGLCDGDAVEILRFVGGGAPVCSADNSY